MAYRLYIVGDKSINLGFERDMRLEDAINLAKQKLEKLKINSPKYYIKKDSSNEIVYANISLQQIKNIESKL